MDHIQFLTKKITKNRPRATCFCQPPLGPKPTSVPTSHHSTRWLKPNGIERLKPSEHSANSSCSPTRLWRCWWVLIGMRIFFSKKTVKKRSLKGELGQITQSNSRKVDSRPFGKKNLTWESSQNGGQKWTKNANINFQRPHPKPLKISRLL